MRFGKNSRLRDLLAHPRARPLVDAALPGLVDHPGLSQFDGERVHVVAEHHPALAGEDEAKNALWEALSRIEAPDPHRGREASRPRTDYEGLDVAEASATAAVPSTASVWSPVDISVRGPSHGNPYTDVDLTARFVRDGESEAVIVGGFYDGGGTWVVRFLPPAPGRWRFVTASNARSLTGVAGHIDVVESAPGDHGPVRRDGFHFAYADGTRYTPLGTTAYAWVHQSGEVRAATLKTLEVGPFTKLRMCVFPKAYAFNTGEPDLYAFEGSPADGFDFSSPNPAFFHRLEQAVVELGRRGIEADVIAFHPYDRWGFAEMGAAADDRYLAYLVRRLAAFPNVWWSFANEYDLLDDKTESDWERLAHVVEANDPVGHLRSIHNFGPLYDHSRGWITHASIQHARTEQVDGWRRE